MFCGHRSRARPLNVRAPREAVRTRGRAVEAAAELEMLRVQQSVPKQLAGPSASPQPGGGDTVEQFPGRPPLIRRHAGIERCVLRPQSALPDGTHQSIAAGLATPTGFTAAEVLDGPLSRARSHQRWSILPAATDLFEAIAGPADDLFGEDNAPTLQRTGAEEVPATRCAERRVLSGR
jgi:hypothetical protein